MSQHDTTTPASDADHPIADFADTVDDALITIVAPIRLHDLKSASRPRHPLLSQPASDEAHRMIAQESLSLGSPASCPESDSGPVNRMSESVGVPGMTLWQIAASLACRLHRGQVRKDTFTPYVAHPFRVAMIVSNIFVEKDQTVAAAALLHDAIEDTPADRDEIAEKVSPEVAGIVCELTKDMRLPEDQREQKFLDDLSKASWQARLIKMADVYDNLCDAPTEAMRFKAVRKAREVLQIAGSDHPSLAIAGAVLQDLIDSVDPDGDERCA